MKSNRQIIHVARGTKYLSEIIKKLPEDCLFSKGAVGIGGSTIAIENNEPYVICVPFVSLIENKTGQYPNCRRRTPIFGYYGDVTKIELKEYLDSVKIPKILVTYDSLEKLCNIINPLDYKILIDEYHLLLTQYSFRSSAINGVLNNYKRFKNFTFMTATPIEERFILKELKDIPLVEAICEDSKTVTVHSTHCPNGVLGTTLKIAHAFLDGSEIGNAYFFVNSVDFIKEIVVRLNLNTRNTRVIYSKNNKTKVGIPNSSTLSSPKKLNFLTSTCWEGSDIMDVDGRIIVISDPSKTQTLVDISTSLTQIAGRIRNSKYLSSISHFYKETRYSNISEEEFESLTKSSINNSNTMINAYNQMDERGKEKMNKFPLDSFYTSVENGIAYFNENLITLDYYNFHITKGVYSLKVNLIEEYQRNGFDVVTKVSNIEKETYTKGNILSFKDAVLQLEAEISTPFNMNTSIRDYCFSKYPWLSDAISKIGFEGIKDCNFMITNIKRKIINISDEKHTVKIIKQLKLKVPVNGNFISSKDLKNIFNKIYKELNIKTTPKGSLIEEYCEVKRATPKIKGKTTEGYNIIRFK